MKLVCARCGYSVTVGPGWYGNYFYAVEDHLRTEHVEVFQEEIDDADGKTVLVDVRVTGKEEMEEFFDD